MIKSNESFNYIGGELDLFKNAKNWKMYFSKKMSKYIQGDVLEVGAGIGINTRYLAGTPEKITSWCLLEPDTKLASQIKTHITDIDIPNKTIVNGTIQSVQGQMFDTIIYIDVLEHIEESKKEIALLKKCLKSNGYVIILVPAYNFLFNNFDRKIGHFRRYNKKLLLKDVDAQLSVVGLFYLDSVGYFASLINKFFLRKELPSIKNVNLWDNYMVPTSKLFDALFFKSFGKSLLGIFKSEQ